MLLMFSSVLRCSDNEDALRSRADFINCLSFFIHNNIDYKKFDYFERAIEKNRDIYNEYVSNIENHKGSIHGIK